MPRGWLQPSLRRTLRNRSIENRWNDNRFRINWSHSVKLTGYVFLRSPPRPTVDFLSCNSSTPPLRPNTFLPPARPLDHETKLRPPPLQTPILQPSPILGRSPLRPKAFFARLCLPSLSLLVPPTDALHTFAALCFLSSKHNFWLQLIRRFSFYLISIRGQPPFGHLLFLSRPDSFSRSSRCFLSRSRCLRFVHTQFLPSFFRGHRVRARRNNSITTSYGRCVSDL